MSQPQDVCGSHTPPLLLFSPPSSRLLIFLCAVTLCPASLGGSLPATPLQSTQGPSDCSTDLPVWSHVPPALLPVPLPGYTDLPTSPPTPPDDHLAPRHPPPCPGVCACPPHLHPLLVCLGGDILCRVCQRF